MVSLPAYQGVMAWSLIVKAEHALSNVAPSFTWSPRTIATGPKPRIHRYWARGGGQCG